MLEDEEKDKKKEEKSKPRFRLLVVGSNNREHAVCWRLSVRTPK